MRTWKRLLVGLLVLLVILGAGSVLFVSLIDPNEYRGAIADLVEELTGRDLEIAGDLRIRVLPTPSVEAHDVTFSNASWASEPDMVRAKRARAEFALLPLLERQRGCSPRGGHRTRGVSRSQRRGSAQLGIRRRW